MSGTPHDWETKWLTMWDPQYTCKVCGIVARWKTRREDPFSREREPRGSDYETLSLGGVKDCPATCEEFLFKAVHES